jgi:hypothetical protein
MKIAIACLLRGYENQFDYTDFILRSKQIKLLVDQEISDNQIDHVIFHEGNINPKMQAVLKKQTGLNLLFRNVHEEFQWDRAVVSVICYSTSLSESFSLGYKSMCRFWFDGFLKYADEYEYIVRIDEDCILFQFDLMDSIRAMEQQQAAYGTPLIYGLDDKDVTIGLKNFTENFQANLGISKAFDPTLNPYTNVAIVSVRKVQQNIIFLKFAQEVHKTGCILINRWGDLPLWGAALQTCFSKDEVIILSQIKYFHGSIGHMVNKTGLFDHVWELHNRFRTKIQKLKAKLHQQSARFL